MPKIVKFNVIDLETKVVIPNITSDEVCERINICRRYLTKCVNENKVAKGRYKIEKFEPNIDDDKINSISLSDLKDWDKIRIPINKALNISGKSIKLICPDLGV